jgi:hypothetical protein
MTDGFAGMGEDVRASLVRLICHISSKLLDPLSSAMRPDRKERVSGVGALGDPLLGLRLLGGHGAARGEGQGNAGEVQQRRKVKERCVGSKQTEAAAQNPL